jgi:hypothetical protein
MTHFGRKVGFQWIFVGVLVLVGFLGLRWAALSEAQAQAQVEEQRRAADEARVRAEEAKQLADKLQAAKEELRRAQAENAAKGVAPLAQKHFLEKGKSYAFYGQGFIDTAVVLEEPRENWVKVRVKEPDGAEKDQWINLNMVHRVVAAPQAREKKDAKKGAVETKGTVKGIVTLNGKPVEKGKVTFHPESGKGIEAGIQLGEYSATDVPVGTLRVTIYGVGLPKKFGIKDQTPLTVEMKKGENRMDFDLKD